MNRRGTKHNIRLGGSLGGCEGRVTCPYIRRHILPDTGLNESTISSPTLKSFCIFFAVLNVLSPTHVSIFLMRNCNAQKISQNPI